MYKKKSFSIAGQQFLLEAEQIRTWVGCLHGISMAALKAYRYGCFAQEPIQCMEGFLVVTDDFMYMQFVLLGYFLVISDAPFITGRSQYQIIRSGRKAFYLGLVLYLCGQTFLYYLLIALATMIPLISNAYIGNVWSEALRILAEVQPLGALTKYGLMFQGKHVMEEMLPIQAFLVSYSFCCLYSFMLALFLMAVNLRTTWAVGNFIVILLQFIQVTALKDVVFIPSLFIPYAHMILNYHFGEEGFSINCSYAVYGGVIFVLLLLILFTTKEIELEKVRGEKIW